MELYQSLQKLLADEKLMDSLDPETRYSIVSFLVIVTVECEQETMPTPQPAFPPLQPSNGSFSMIFVPGHTPSSYPACFFFLVLIPSSIV